MARVSKWIALAVRLGLALTFAYTGVAKLTPDVNRSLYMGYSNMFRDWAAVWDISRFGVDAFQLRQAVAGAEIVSALLLLIGQQVGALGACLVQCAYMWTNAKQNRPMQEATMLFCLAFFVFIVAQRDVGRKPAASQQVKKTKKTK